MMRPIKLLWVGIAALMASNFVLSAKVGEAQTNSPQIIINQLKITSSSGQFITLYNNSSSTLDLSTIQLQYYNNFDLLKATSGKLISLSGKVSPHGYAVINDGPLQACYQATIDSVSLGLSSTSGFIQVAHFLGNTSPQVVSILDDYVGWSKASTTGAQVLPSSSNVFLQRKALNGSQDYSSITAPGMGSWIRVNQPDGAAPCDSATASVASNGGAVLSTSSSPVPFSTLAATNDNSLTSIPAVDSGLAAPQISEVMPNPASPQSDSEDEFIELYNPNATPFDLSNFILQVGTSTLHKFSFPNSTILAPNQFAAFYSTDTNLSLNNSGGQVKLLDPGGNVLGQTDIYDNANDGEAWIPVDGLWQWTSKPTPNAANIISVPSAKNTGKVKAAKTSKTTSNSSNSRVNNSNTSLATKDTPSTPLHFSVLAAIGALVLVYSVYEYRHDLANQIYKFRRYREARRAAG